MSLGVDQADIIAVRAELRRMLGGLAPEWHAEALCQEFDLRLWFPVRGERNQPALEVCGRCAVRIQCLTEALDDPTLDYGIRGGATANARKAMRRQKGPRP